MCTCVTLLCFQCAMILMYDMTTKTMNLMKWIDVLVCKNGFMINCKLSKCSDGAVCNIDYVHTGECCAFD